VKHPYAKICLASQHFLRKGWCFEIRTKLFQCDAQFALRWLATALARLRLSLTWESHRCVQHRINRRGV